MIKLMKSTFFDEKRTKEKLCNFIKKAKILSMGDECKKFEYAFSKYQKREYSVFFNNGSSANLALIQSLLNLGKISLGDNVGFSALTWATNVMPIIELGLNPIPIDVSLVSLNVDSEQLLKALKKTDIKVLFLTNLLGFCGDIDTIKEICKKRRIILLEDNCESLGSEFKGIKLGNFGLASTFSFFVGHHFSTIEGGMVCTDDPKLRDMLIMVRAHGWDRNLEIKEQKKLRKDNCISDFYSKYSFYCLAYNLRPTEINGFVANQQFPYIKEICIKRKKNFIRFNKAAKKNINISHLDFDGMNFISNFAYPIVCKNKKTFDEYLKLFRKNNVEIRPIVGGSMVEQPFFKKFLKEKKSQTFSCANSKKIHKQGFYVPNNPELTEKELKKLCNLISSMNK